MAQLFFHCSNDDGVWIDRRIAPATNLTEAMEQATRVVRALVMAPSFEDWRGWTLHASDDFGEEIFAMPFASVLGKAHWRASHVHHPHHRFEFSASALDYGVGGISKPLRCRQRPVSS